MDGDVRRPSVVVAGKTIDARNEKTRGGGGMEGDRRRVGRGSRRTPIASGRREPKRRPSETRVPNRAARGGVTKAHGPRGRRRPKAETSWKPAGQRARRLDVPDASTVNGERHRRAKPNVATRARERRRTPRGDVPASRVFARRARLGASRGRAREPERPGRRPGVRPPRIARANLRLESHRGQ